MDLFLKSMHTLELNEVLHMLSKEAVCEAAKERALKLFPFTDYAQVEYALAETTKAKNLMVVRGAPPFSDIKDVRASISRAELGGVLSIRELQDIALVLRSTRNVQNYAEEEELTLKQFAALHANKYLEDRITNSIANEEELADAASSELAAIRRHIRVANARVRETLQRIVSSPKYAKILQEPIITMRSDRYVVPVKSEYKGSFQGLVHDISSSGSTLFIEPIQAVQINNEIRELQAREKKEVERILMELSAECVEYADDIICNFNILVELDMIFAKAKLSYTLNCSEPELSKDGSIVLKKARHPLLDRSSVVPIDISIGGEYDTLVITGPNTGGKTVSLKTLGLLAAMTQCGLHIPVDDGSKVSVLRGIFADIGDEQSIEQSLSTFSSHMKNIVEILKEADKDILILFDELGAGTDPVEGAVLAISIIEYARKRSAMIAATTHYAELKIYATTEPGVMNASCEFDVETLQPTYRLLIGIPGKSNAFAISKKLGLPETIIDDARGRLNSQSADFEEVLTLLEKQRQEMEKEHLETNRLLMQAREDAKISSEKRREIEKEREKATRTARREAAAILEQARNTADEVFLELNRMRRNIEQAESAQELNQVRSQLRKKLNEAEEHIRINDAPVIEKKSARPPKKGDRVQIIGIGTKADVVDINADGTLVLQAGILKITAKPSEVIVIEQDAMKKEAKRIARQSEAKLRNLSVSPEIDLRGMSSEEGIAALEHYLDSAVLAKLPSVRIIHGKGSGVLRAAVHQYLKRSNQVKTFRLGRYGEGEDGVTIAEL